MKEEKITARIVDLTDKGNCVAKADACVYFLKSGVVGDLVRLKPTVQKKNCCDAEVLEILEPSPHRVQSDCQYSERCGGCTLREYHYDAQIKLKARVVCEKIKRLAGIQNFQLDKIIPAREPNYYRNNVQLKCSWENGSLCIGFYERFSHRIVAMEQCLLLPPIMNRALKRIKLFLEELYRTHDIRKIFALETLQEIILRTEESEQKLMLILVKQKFSQSISEYKKTLADFAHSTHIVSLYEQDKSGALQLLYGEQTLSVQILGKQFQLSPQSFFQVNIRQAALLFTEVLNELDAKPTDIVLDLFCGVGSISLIVAEHVQQLIGVECVSSAVQNAQCNATRNHIHNAKFILGTVENILNPHFLPEANFGTGKINKIIVDPPRAGIDPRALVCIAKAAPEKIIYVSCNPATLARDLKILCEYNFTISRTAVVDMFPYTAHVESVVTLTRASM